MVVYGEEAKDHNSSWDSAESLDRAFQLNKFLFLIFSPPWRRGSPRVGHSQSVVAAVRDPGAVRGGGRGGDPVGSLQYQGVVVYPQLTHLTASLRPGFSEQNIPQDIIIRRPHGAENLLTWVYIFQEFSAE